MYKPRFDFGKEFDPSGEQTGTVKDLLEELNYEKFKTATGTHAEKGDSSGTSVTFDSLNGVFEFLSDVTGMSKPKLAHDVTLSTLKVIKLLLPIEN